MRKHTLAGLFACAFSTAGAAEPLKPVYSSIQDCPQLQSLTLPDRTVSHEQGFTLMRCKGVGGYDLVVVDENPRSWLAVVGPDGAHSLFRPMLQDFKLGHFPDISATKLVEWRVNAEGVPFAFIVRVHYQDPDLPADKPAAQRSILMVFGLGGGEPRLLGMSRENLAARLIADSE